MHAFNSVAGGFAAPRMCYHGDCLAKLRRQLLAKPKKSLNALTPAANAAITGIGVAPPQTSAHLHRTGQREKLTVWHCLKNWKCQKYMPFENTLHRFLTTGNISHICPCLPKQTIDRYHAPRRKHQHVKTNRNNSDQKRLERTLSTDCRPYTETLSRT